MVSISFAFRLFFLSLFHRKNKDSFPIVESDFKTPYPATKRITQKEDAFAQLIAGLQRICDYVRRPDTGQQRLSHFNSRY